ncbi:hypothetical protein Daus18300_013345 [Diaporthe australafricana]|uniref:USP domain-containing protein n=1 Tax=Diaporthe australafricana TaxID=127596 RepID=A0ABR3VZF0_9PEZI
MAGEPNPEHWQFPRLPDKDGHDLPTATGEANWPLHHDQLHQILVSPPLNKNDVLVQEITRGASKFYPVVAENILPAEHARFRNNLSWLGATLMALFNVSPLLSLLNEAKASGQVVDPMVDVLHDMEQRFRTRIANQVTDQDQRAAIENDVRVIWRLIRESRIGHPEPYHMLPHPADFAHYLLRWIAQALLKQTVGSKNTMRRQAAVPSDYAGYVMGTVVQETKSLEQAIAEHMWEDQARTRTCPDCNKQVKTNDFLKYAYLPEVLFIHSDFTPRPGSIHVSPDVRFTYPKRLDMSDLRDAPTRPGDQTDCVYKLESIVTWLNNSNGSGMHYKAALRQDGSLWNEFNDRPQPEGSMTAKTLDEIKGDDSYKPWLLIYVRERGARAPANLQSAVRRQPIQISPPVLIHPPFLTSAAAGVTSDPYNLERFVTAQHDGYADGTTFMDARDQLGSSRRTGHWTWYIFPTMTTLYASTSCPDGVQYTIESLAEARAYWNHRGLRERYMQLLGVLGRCHEDHPIALFGAWNYAHNFHQSLTLFMLICNPSELNTFQTVTWKFFGGRFDKDTAWQVLRLIHAKGDNHALREAFARINYTDPDQLIPPPSGGDGGNVSSSTAGDQTLPTVTVTQPAINTAKTTQPPLGQNNTVDQPGPSNGSSNGAGHGKTGPSGDTGAFSGSGETNDAYEIGSVLLALADINLSRDNPIETNDIGALNDQARRLGHTILDFAHPLVVPAPTNATNERARRLGRHLIRASLPGDPSDDAAAHQNGAQPDDGRHAGSASRADGTSDLDSRDVSAFGGDGTFDVDSDHGNGDDHSDSSILDGDDDTQPNDEEPYGYVAIPTDPNDARIQACEDWTLADFREAFHDEGLDWRGLRNDAEKYQAKFLKHFELERDYSIYHETKLRKVVREKVSGVKRDANKAELVEVLTDYDEDVLQHFEYVTDEDESEETDSGGSSAVSEDYESSLASGTEALFIGARRDETAGGKGRKKAAVQPRVVASAARARKRSRDDDDDDDDKEEERRYGPRWLSDSYSSDLP